MAALQCLDLRERCSMNIGQDRIETPIGLSAES